ncbi:adenylate/guanylate cyclase domain-containing protein [Bradyrhizobium sp. CB3481]|uniref:adenylate/guanylate cyclase domain-containing protein n=1 Tax=Bradyrhizobium sp. CB3481 TaxID=3039158 RepID=UPI0024B0CD3D|nr:adenylate/guanylate cyclase domain-containing protein [Bradyrhizobium sp. CB3481]WFU19414.1 adenylate/guanylate cyclase domain-containing protein [Bradyrhizobium sp. CB3481]
MVQDRPVRVERRLAAILAADVAGYSRLMHHDEEATHAKLTSLLTEAVHPAIAEYGGRIVKNTGDGFLAEFPSAVQAARAAVQFQNRVRELTAADAQDARIALRVGINVGDVIVEPHDIFGDGVNIAARLESIAEPGGICISSSAMDHVRGKVSVEFVDLGEQDLKNIARLVRAYAVVVDGPSPATQIKRATQDAPKPPRLSIVVLPFTNLSGDHQQDYFADGVTESLTTDLSRIKDAFVIGRHTAFAYKGEAHDLRKVGRELNVRYVLEGSVQRSGKRFRVNVQLIDAETANHIWAERFDKPVADLFDTQDEIVSLLANALNAQLIEAEAQRAQHSVHPDATDLTFQGFSWSYKGPTFEYVAQARIFFERALEIDPRSYRALVGMARVHLAIGAGMLADDRAAQLLAAETNAIKAVSLAPDYPWGHLALGGALIFTNRASRGIAEFEQVLRLDRNSADAHAYTGLAKVFLGRSAETEAHVVEAFRLSPRDIAAYQWMHIAGTAKLQLGADVEAVTWLQRSLNANRNFPLTHFVLAAALGLLGEMDEARAAAKAGLALQPDFTIGRLRAVTYSDNATYLAARERLCVGLRLAAVPEG